MADFLPLVVSFPGRRPILVSSLADAEATLGSDWPDRAAASYLHAARLLAEARSGACKPRVAFEAYRIAAGRQHLLVDTDRSAALQVLDALAAESIVVPPER
jgi:hypothetical protein